MTDIVERLRDGCGIPRIAKMMDEGADEIERLRTDIDKLMAERDGWLQEIEQLRAKILPPD